MENLAQELIDQISSYLDRSDLRATLAVNSEFQIAAERYCGAFERFDTSQNSADLFFRTFSGRHFHHLRHVSFSTTLVPGDMHQCRRETKDTFHEYNESFTEQIRFLFHTLSTLEQKAGRIYGPGNISLTIFTPAMNLDPSAFCSHRAFVSWRVSILDPGALPILKFIRRLRVENGADFMNPFADARTTMRKVELRMLLDLSYRLPALEHLACGIGGDEWPLPLSESVSPKRFHVHQGPRRDTRHEFAKCLDPALLPVNIRELELNFIRPFSHLEFIDQNISMPDLQSPYPYDPFSTSLRFSSYLLRRMSLFAVVDETLFWPTQSEEIPSWPHLEALDVCFPMLSPSGKWYFQGLQDKSVSNGYELDDRAYPPFETTTEDRSWCEQIDRLGEDVMGTHNFVLYPTMPPYYRSWKLLPRPRIACHD